MHEINLYNIQIIDLELFLAAARYKSFTKAAEKMFTTQSWVSKRIQLMERELNLQLFIRQKGKVALTPAGKVLAKKLEQITSDLGDAITEASMAMTGTSGVFRIGFLEWGVNALYQCVETFSEENQQISVEIYSRQLKELVASLDAGKIDIMFNLTYDRTHFKNDTYHMKTIERVPLVVYMNRKNPLSKKKSLTIKDLQTQSLLMLDQKSAEDYSTYISNLFKSHGIRPFVAQYAHNGREHLGNILLNRGILIASQYFLRNEYSDQIVAVPLEKQYLNIDAVWKSENTSPIIERFLTAVENWKSQEHA